MIEGLCAAFGFEKQAVYAAPDGAVMHSQLTFGNRMIMVGSVNNDTAVSNLLKQPDEIGGAETQTPYLVVSDIDAIYARAKIAGAKMVVDLEEKDYGGKAFSCTDPDGPCWNLRSLGDTANMKGATSLREARTRRSLISLTRRIASLQHELRRVRAGLFARPTSKAIRVVTTHRRKKHTFEPRLIDPAQLIFFRLIADKSDQGPFRDARVLKPKPTKSDPFTNTSYTCTQKIRHIGLAIAIAEARTQLQFGELSLDRPIGSIQPLRDGGFAHASSVVRQSLDFLYRPASARRG
jgi:uncharacterized glyoxalase superfamily protein PhnB